MKPSQRKFFQQMIQVEILSEDVPLEWDNLHDVAHAINEGDCSGKVQEVSCKRVDGPTMAILLLAQESDPGFVGAIGGGLFGFRVGGRLAHFWERLSARLPGASVRGAKARDPHSRICPNAP